MPLCVSGTGGRYTKGYVRIKNGTIATLRRGEIASHQMEAWDDLWPGVIRPGEEVRVKIKFRTWRSLDWRKSFGRVAYEAEDNAGLLLGHFAISVDAEDSHRACCVLKVFQAKLSVDWGSLAKVFGIELAPRKALGLPFVLKGVTELVIAGNLLRGGPRDPMSRPRMSDFADWPAAMQAMRVGDVVAADRGAFRHMGIVREVQRSDEDGVCEVLVSHLSGTAGEVLSSHGLQGGVREVFSATLAGSHGSIAGVQTVPLRDFSGDDPVRVENLHDDAWAAYEEAVMLERMAQAEGTRDYSLFEFNCEHYANLVRYGMPSSAQLDALRRKLDLRQHGRELRDGLRSGIRERADGFKNQIREQGHDLKVQLKGRILTELVGVGALLAILVVTNKGFSDDDEPQRYRFTALKYCESKMRSIKGSKARLLTYSLPVT